MSPYPGVFPFALGHPPPKENGAPRITGVTRSANGTTSSYGPISVARSRCGHKWVKEPPRGAREDPNAPSDRTVNSRPDGLLGSRLTAKTKPERPKGRTVEL